MTDQAPRFAPPAADDLLDRAHQADLEPWALLRAVRDSAGRVVDFVYHDINPVGARRQQRRREDLIGRSVAETLDHGLLQTFAHCVDTGEPLVLDAFALHGGDRRYDVRGARVPPDFLSLSWREVTGRIEALAALRASTDAILDPQVLIEPVRDPGGRVTDFVYREVNPAMCDYLGMRREQLIGHPLLETLPSLDASGLLGHLARCADTGEPVVLDEFPYYNEFLDSVRRYDIRAARTTVGKLSLTLRDVTERFESVRKLAESEERYRLLLLNSGDAVLHVRDGVVVWVSPAIYGVLGAPAEHWVGTRLREVVPLGMFADTEFAADRYRVPAGAQIPALQRRDLRVLAAGRQPADPDGLRQAVRRGGLDTRMVAGLAHHADAVPQRHR